MLVAILAASAVMSGLSGFGFSAIGALSLFVLPPLLAVPLLMTLSTANQMLSLNQLKADFKPLKEWWPDGPALSTHSLCRLGGPETGLRFQPPLIKPSMRFSRTRLSEAVHRTAVGVTWYHATVPESWCSPSAW